MNQPLETTWDGGKQVHLILEGSDHASGDNYKVLASFDPPDANGFFPCEATSPEPCAESPVITVWKRIYVEQESMFRSGSFLDALAPAGTTDFIVENPDPFIGLPPGSTLELVHSDAGDGAGFYADLVKFQSVLQMQDFAWHVKIDSAGGVPQRDYGSNESSSNPNLNVRRDAIGIPSAGFFEADDGYVKALFEQMYIDVQHVQPVVAEVPYVPELSDGSNFFFAHRWLEFGHVTGPYTRHPDPNIFHRMAVAQAPLKLKQAANGTGGGYGAELGATMMTGSNFSFVFAKRIIDLSNGIVKDPAGQPVGLEYAGLLPSSINREVTAHETVHFFVHSGGVDGAGHCLFDRYQHDGLQCLMHVPYSGPGLADGVVDLHYQSYQGNVDSEYVMARTTVEPVPQQ